MASIEELIAYGIKPPQVDPDIAQRVMSLRAITEQRQEQRAQAGQQRQITQMELDAKRRSVEGTRTLSDLLSKYTDPATGKTDHASVQSGLAGAGYGDLAGKYGVDRRADETSERANRKAELDNRKAELENGATIHAQIADALGAVTKAPEAEKPAVYAAVVNHLLAAKLMQPGDLPEQYDPTKFAAAVALGQSLKDQLAAARADVELAIKKADSEAERPGKVADSATKVITAEQTKELGMPKKDAETLKATAARDASTAAYQSAQVKQGAQRIGLEGQRVGLEGRRVANDERVAQQFASTQAGGGPALTGDAYLKTLSPPVAAQVRAIAEGRQTNLPRGKELMPLMNAVNQYDPTYTTQRAKIRGAFTTGPDGRNIGALNTAVVHLDQLHEAAKAMNNGTWQPGNAAYNYIAEKFGQPATTNYRFVMNALAGEAATALKGNATDPEIAHILPTLQQNLAPDQGEGVALAGLHVFAAKLNTYDERYHAVVPDDPWSPVYGSARRVFERYKINPIERTSSGGGHAAGGAPAGVVVVDPNGGKHTFPNQAAADNFKRLAGIK